MANTRAMNHESVSIWRGWNESVTSHIMLIYCCIIPERNIYIYIYIYTYFCGPGSSVGIGTDYGLESPESNPGGGRDSLPVQNGSGAHPVSCTISTMSFPGVEAAGAWG